MMPKENTEFLWRYFENIRFWVDYAVKTNAVLFTIVGLEMAILKFIERPANLQFLNIAICFLSVAFLISFLSFFPRTERMTVLGWGRSDQVRPPENLIFFEEIKHCQPDELAGLLGQKYGIGPENDPLLLDICDQVVILSRIASAKYRYFKYAFFFTVLGQFSLFAILLVNLLYSGP